MRIAESRIEIVEGEDAVRQKAIATLDLFLPYLAEQYPELGITPETEWQPCYVVSPFIVTYYLFFSEEWELGLWWHVMIAPNDWARIYLRRRYQELAPSLAFEIPSLSAPQEPQQIEPPESIYR